MRTALWVVGFVSSLCFAWYAGYVHGVKDGEERRVDFECFDYGVSAFWRGVETGYDHCARSLR